MLLELLLVVLLDTYLIYNYFVPIFKETKGQEVSFGMKDINLSIMLLGNFANIIMFISRFVAGLDGDNNITFFNYSIVILNVFLTAVIMNLNTIVLRRLSLSKEIRLIVFSFLTSLILGLSLVYIIHNFGMQIIQFIFQRGAFSFEDTVNTFAYAKDLSISFIFIFIASALFQPFFSIDQKIIRHESRTMASILVASTFLLFIKFQFVPSTARDNSLVMIFTLSIISMFLSIYSVFRYFRIKFSMIELIAFIGLFIIGILTLVLENRNILKFVYIPSLIIFMIIVRLNAFVFNGFEIDILTYALEMKSTL